MTIKTTSFKFNNLGLTLGMALKFYANVARGLKLKIKKILVVIPTFLEVTGGKLVRGAFLLHHHAPHPRILNRVKLLISFKKAQIVAKFKQNAWLKPYIDINTDLRKKAKKNDLEIDFYKIDE